MQFDPLDRSDRYKFEILKTQDGGGRQLEKSKNRDTSEIWPDTQFDQFDLLGRSDR